VINNIRFKVQVYVIIIKSFCTKVMLKQELCLRIH